MTLKPYLECGKIINTHGVYGAVKLESWCDSPAVLAALKTLWYKTGGGMAPLKLRRASVFKQFVIAEIEGVNDVDAAVTLKNTVVYAAREDLDPGDGHFVADLIGLPILDAASGERLGVLREVISRSTQDIYVVDTPAGERMIPAVAEFIRGIDLSRGVLVAPIPGLLD